MVTGPSPDPVLLLPLFLFGPTIKDSDINRYFVSPRFELVCEDVGPQVVPVDHPGILVVIGRPLPEGSVES